LTPRSKKRTSGNGQAEPYRDAYSDAAIEDLKRLKRVDRKAFQNAMEAIEAVRMMPRMGTPLRDKWEGCLHRHFGRDKYRVIWDVDDDDRVVGILRVGKKKLPHGTIYDEPRPARP
jgi:mRNA-degrading endonuclease RelE of RelBE toxin-antitoxin system